jgi:hypothetical protein
LGIVGPALLAAPFSRGFPLAATALDFPGAACAGDASACGSSFGAFFCEHDQPPSAATATINRGARKRIGTSFPRTTSNDREF